MFVVVLQSKSLNPLFIKVLIPTSRQVFWEALVFTGLNPLFIKVLIPTPKKKFLTKSPGTAASSQSFIHQGTHSDEAAIQIIPLNELNESQSFIHQGTHSDRWSKQPRMPIAERS